MDGDWRSLDLDGQQLHFNRVTGVNMLIRSQATMHLRQRAPRVVQFSLTNACNKSCSFCYRPLEAASLWTFDEVLAFARFAEDWGVLELAFGGGEPLAFKGFAELLRTIWQDTALCTNFTTNGLLLSPSFLREIEGSYGQIQLSIYEEDDYEDTIELLASEGARFGLNYLVTPKRLRSFDADLMRFARKGARDVLLLSYKGRESELHLTMDEVDELDARIVHMSELLRDHLELKVDVCWGARLRETPRLLDRDDCGAGGVFLSIGSHREVMPCSFAQHGIRFESFSEIPPIYEAMRGARTPVPSPGCARLKGFGLSARRLPLASA